MSAITERRGLGRGLGELLLRTEPDEPQSRNGHRDATHRGNDDRQLQAEGSHSAEPSTVPPSTVPGGSYFTELAGESISANPRQPRSVFDEDALAELVESIREVGLLQPIVVRPLGSERFELVMGERRWRAARQAGLTRIPAIVRNTEDHELLRDALLENLHRTQLNPLEEAAAYQQMLQDFGCTQDELASRIKRSRPQISNTIRLLRLPAAVQRRVAAGVLSAGHARALLGLDDPERQEWLASRVVAEGLSVRDVEELVVLDEPRAAGPRRRPEPQFAPEADDVARRLSDVFETRVKVTMGKSKGRITVEFASLDDLKRIEALITPELSGSQPVAAD